MTKSSFAYIEHTSDIGIHSRGETKEKLFEQCALGMVSIMIDTGNIAPDLEEKIEVEAGDDEGLLYGFLSEALYLFDGEEFIPLKFKNSGFQGSDLKNGNLRNRKFENENLEYGDLESGSPGNGKFITTALGCRFNPAIHKIKTEIKAVTFHRMKIEKRDNIWETDVIFDV